MNQSNEITSLLEIEIRKVSAYLAVEENQESMKQLLDKLYSLQSCLYWYNKALK